MCLRTTLLVDAYFGIADTYISQDCVFARLSLVDANSGIAYFSIEQCPSLKHLALRPRTIHCWSKPTPFTPKDGLDTDERGTNSICEETDHAPTRMTLSSLESSPREHTFLSQHCFYAYVRSTTASNARGSYSEPYATHSPDCSTTIALE